MPLKCPVPTCSKDPCKDLDALTKHVLYSYRFDVKCRHSGKGAGMRGIHYKWLKQNNVTPMYKPLRRYLENLLSQG